MRPVLDLLKHERRARIFFLALAQSSLGTGAAYVALLLVAYERFRSPWAIGLILLADVLPAMVLGPVFGAVADRCWRRWRGLALAYSHHRRWRHCPASWRNDGCRRRAPCTGLSWIWASWLARAWGLSYCW